MVATRAQRSAAAAAAAPPASVRRALQSDDVLTGVLSQLDVREGCLRSVASVSKAWRAAWRLISEVALGGVSGPAWTPSSRRRPRKDKLLIPRGGGLAQIGRKTAPGADQGASRAGAWMFEPDDDDDDDEEDDDDAPDFVDADAEAYDDDEEEEDE